MSIVPCAKPALLSIGIKRKNQSNRDGDLKRKLKPSNHLEVFKEVVGSVIEPLGRRKVTDKHEAMTCDRMVRPHSARNSNFATCQTNRATTITIHRMAQDRIFGHLSLSCSSLTRSHEDMG